MILSASYRTDIPAFHGAWFADRMAAGFAMVPNPYGGQPSRLDLSVEALDAIVFWTRNAKPFLPVLEDLAAQSIPFVIHYTVTGYPPALDGGTPPTAHAIEVMRHLRARFGPKAVVWRYDPILFSDCTDLVWHQDQIGTLARQLSGITDEVVLSWLYPYQKTRRNLKKAGVVWRDPEDAEKRRSLLALAEQARNHGGMRVSLCAQPHLLPLPLEGGSLLGDAACIDVDRLSEVAGRPIFAKPNPHRSSCRCVQSRDIGSYDSCAHGCVYCYAVSSPSAGQRGVARAQRAPAGSPFLMPKP